MNTKYDGIINKPDIDDIFIAHYGVKGMKWRRRKAKKSNLRYLQNRRVNRKVFI